MKRYFLMSSKIQCINSCIICSKNYINWIKKIKCSNKKLWLPFWCNHSRCTTLNYGYNKVAFNKKLAIMKENLHNKYTPYTYKYIALNEKPPITKQNLRIFFVMAELSIYTNHTMRSYDQFLTKHLFEEQWNLLFKMISIHWLDNVLVYLTPFYKY